MLCYHHKHLQASQSLFPASPGYLKEKSSLMLSHRNANDTVIIADSEGNCKHESQKLTTNPDLALSINLIKKTDHVKEIQRTVAPVSGTYSETVN